MKNKWMDEADHALLHTYNRYPIVLEKGEGVYLYDTEGKKYLDFAAGIAVCSLGYGYKGYTEALKSQIDLLLHTSNLYYSRPAADAAAKLAKAAQMDRIFFTNSGTEAIEGALKAARKYAYTEGSGKFEIIAMEHSFHGRSMGALSVTATESYRTPFEPLIGGVKFARYNDLESVKEQFSDKTCAVIMETLQGEGGIYPIDPEFFRGVRELCDERGALLILDEIQCGMGRTGTMFAWQDYGVKPDIMAMAKAIGGGVPVGAFAMTEKVAEKSLAPGDHGTTYGGNPFVCAAVSKVLDIYEEEHILEHVKKVSAYLEKKLDALAAKSDAVKERRGKGLMQGLAMNVPVGEVIAKAQEEGLLVISAGGNVLRIVPPLIITEDHVDEMIEKLKKAL
ncbi:MAG TPA: aspartate aminotransferase family protein [Candidatus Dorea faecipullorum]|nr:aspartate aminotransferase family protein [Candidatus Dorea faecipullorum]